MASLIMPYIGVFGQFLMVRQQPVQKVPRNYAFSPLLSLVFAFPHPFQHRKTRFLGVRNRHFPRRIKSRKEPAHRFFAGRALGQRGGRNRAAQSKLAATYLAAALAQFVFVKWHPQKITARLCLVTFLEPAEEV